MDDVFDEDLARELGLDPAELKADMPKPKVAAPGAARPPSRPVPPRAGSVPPSGIQPPSAAPTAARPTPPPPQSAAVPTAAPPATGETVVTSVVNEVPVTVAAVLAKKNIKLKEIADYKPGTVIEFAKNPGDLVDLVANGKLIARAELVLIEGQLGARIIKLVGG